MNIPDYFQVLNQNEKELFALLASCSEKELSHHEEANWSIFQNLEHIWLTEKTVVRLLNHPIEKKSEQEEMFGAEKLIKIIVKLRARQVKAPDFLQPKGEISSVMQFKKEFTLNRDCLKNGLLSGEILIDSGIYPHPYLGDMTRRDWLHFIPAHTKRHIDQMSDLLEKIRT